MTASSTRQGLKSLAGNLCLVMCLLTANDVTCYKVLLLPSMPFGSHLICITKIGEHLNNAGHDVTLLLGHYNDLNKTAAYGKQLKIYNTCLDFSFHEYCRIDLIPESLRGHRYNYTCAKNIREALLEDCRTLLENDILHDELHSAEFDIAVVDKAAPCSILLAQKLSLPFVVVSVSRIMSQRDTHYMAMPNPMSYVPAAYSELTDKMTFSERLLNLGLNFLVCYHYNYVRQEPYRDLKKRYGIQPDTGMLESMGQAELFLFVSDWSLEFPHPMMPNTVFIGGLLAEKASRLTREWEEFVNSATDGVVLFSFGGYINPGDSLERAEMITAALSRLPQKVIMRYKGEVPQNLGNNTKLAAWIPQNDLLGHPQTKAFVTHGGINGIYQGIFHGVPMVTIPLRHDQFSNAVRLTSKGVGVALNMRTLTSDQFYQAIKTVIDEPSYKQNAVRLSKIHRDRPMSPGDSAVFWIEHVIKYGGQHLRAEAFNLNFVQYFMLDVVVFLLISLLLVIFLIRKFISFLYTMYCKQTQKVKLN